MIIRQTTLFAAGVRQEVQHVELLIKTRNTIDRSFCDAITAIAIQLN